MARLSKPSLVWSSCWYNLRNWLSLISVVSQGISPVYDIHVINKCDITFLQCRLYTHVLHYLISKENSCTDCIATQYFKWLPIHHSLISHVTITGQLSDSDQYRLCELLSVSSVSNLPGQNPDAPLHPNSSLLTNLHGCLVPPMSPSVLRGRTDVWALLDLKY